MHDAMSGEVASVIRWHDGCYMISYGEGIRHLYEDSAFDLQGLLDEFHKRILDNEGWGYSEWVDV